MQLFTILLPALIFSTVTKPNVIYVQDPNCYTDSSLLNVTIVGSDINVVAGCPDSTKCEFDPNKCPHLTPFPILVVGIYTGWLSRLSIFNENQLTLGMEDLKNISINIPTLNRTLNSRILSIQLWMFDGQCDRLPSANIVGKALSTNPPDFFKLVFGPTCFLYSAEINTVTYSYNLLQVDTQSTDSDLGDLSKYPYMCRITNNIDLIAVVVLRMLDFFNWNTFDILRATNSLYTTTIIYDLLQNADDTKFYKNYTVRNLVQAFEGEPTVWPLNSSIAIAQSILDLEMRLILFEGPESYLFNFYCGFLHMGSRTIPDNIYVFSAGYAVRPNFIHDPSGFNNLLDLTCFNDNFTAISSAFKYMLGTNTITSHPQGDKLSHGLTGRNISQILEQFETRCVVRCSERLNGIYDGITAVIYLFESLLQYSVISLNDINYENSTSRQLLYNEFAHLEFEGVTGNAKWFKDGSCERQSEFVLRQMQGDELIVVNVATFDTDGLRDPKFLLPIFWGTRPNESKSDFTNLTGTSISELRLEYSPMFPTASLKCGVGQYFNRSQFIHDRICSPCLPGFEPDGTNECRKCDAGFFSKDGTLCEPCLPGNFTTLIGQNECKKCPVGTKWTSTTECTECSPGTFNDRAGAVLRSCKVCPTGTYQLHPGATSCEHCQTHFSLSSKEALTTVFAGADSLLGCVCAPGYYLPCLVPHDVHTKFLSTHELFNGCGLEKTFNSSLVCTPCPKGFTCPGGAILYGSDDTLSSMYHSPPRLLENYMSLLDDPYNAYVCVEPKVCTGGTIGTASCSGIREGVACSVCPSDTYLFNDTCEDCQPYLIVLFVFLIALIPVMIILTYVLANGKITIEVSSAMLTAISLGMLVTLVQAVTVFGNLSIPYPDSIQGFYQSFRIFTFDLDFLSLRCVFGSASDVEVYLFECLMPLLIPLFIFVLYELTNHCSLFTWMSTKFSAEKSPRLRLAFEPWILAFSINTFGFIFQALFILIIAIVAIPFDCYTHAFDVKSIRNVPAVICGSSEHIGMLVIGVIFIIVYGVGFISWSIWATVNAPHISIISQDFIRQYRFLFYRFKPNRYYWGVFVLIRNFFIAFAYVLSPDDPNGNFLIMFTILLIALCAQIGYWPWRTTLLNFVDLGVFFFLLFIICISSVFNNPPDDEGPYINCIFVFFSFILILVLLVLVYGIYSLLREKYGKPREEQVNKILNSHIKANKKRRSSSLKQQQSGSRISNPKSLENNAESNIFESFMKKIHPSHSKYIVASDIGDNSSIQVSERASHRTDTDMLCNRWTQLLRTVAELPRERHREIITNLSTHQRRYFCDVMSMYIVDIGSENV